MNEQVMAGKLKKKIGARVGQTYSSPAAQSQVSPLSNQPLRGAGSTIAGIPPTAGGVFGGYGPNQNMAARMASGAVAGLPFAAGGVVGGVGPVQNTAANMAAGATAGIQPAVAGSVAGFNPLQSYTPAANEPGMVPPGDTGMPQSRIPQSIQPSGGSVLAPQYYGDILKVDKEIAAQYPTRQPQQIAMSGVKGANGLIAIGPADEAQRAQVVGSRYGGMRQADATQRPQYSAPAQAELARQQAARERSAQVAARVEANAGMKFGEGTAGSPADVAKAVYGNRIESGDSSWAAVQRAKQAANVKRRAEQGEGAPAPGSLAQRLGDESLAQRQRAVETRQKQKGEARGFRLQGYDAPTAYAMATPDPLLAGAMGGNRLAAGNLQARIMAQGGVEQARLAADAATEQAKIAATPPGGVIPPQQMMTAQSYFDAATQSEIDGDAERADMLRRRGQEALSGDGQGGLVAPAFPNEILTPAQSAEVDAIKTRYVNTPHAEQAVKNYLLGQGIPENQVYEILGQTGVRGWGTYLWYDRNDPNSLGAIQRRAIPKFKHSE